MLKQILTLKQVLECSVCGCYVSPHDVHVRNLLTLLIRLKRERLALCPSCTQPTPDGLQDDPAYRAKWDRFVRQQIAAKKRGAMWHTFEHKP